MSEWQGIETAPKDGSTLIMKQNDRPYAPCQWSPPGECSEDGFWIWWQAEPEYLTELKNPTHWQHA